METNLGHWLIFGVAAFLFLLMIYCWIMYFYNNYIYSKKSKQLNLQNKVSPYDIIAPDSKQKSHDIYLVQILHCPPVSMDREGNMYYGGCRK